MRIAGWFFGIALIAVIGVTLWLSAGSTPQSPGASGPNTDLVGQLRDFYAQAEQLETSIRALRQKGENYQSEQAKLATVRDSIHTIRSRIEATADQSAPAPQTSRKQENVFARLPVNPMWIMAGLAFVLMLGFALVLKNRVFGQAHQPRPAFTPPSMPALTPTQEKPRPRQAVPPAPPAAPPAEPEPPPPPPPPPEPKPAPAPKPTPSAKAGSIHEQILDLHKQGLSVKDISTQLKIEQDQITLALRVHGK